MNFWETNAGLDAIPRMTHAIKELTSELKRANDLKEKELKDAEIARMMESQKQKRAGDNGGV